MHEGAAAPLARYQARRRFELTPEPAGAVRATGAQLSFVVQKHAARRLHYDLRLELDGVLLSWALPKGPSLDPADKRMAVPVEDHPLDYASFEGSIPPGHYGAGRVIVWDRGTWQPVGDARSALAAGKLEFELQGQKLRGRWELINTNKPGATKPLWLLFKKRSDRYARPRAEFDVLTALPDSVLRVALRKPPTGAPAAATAPRATSLASPASPLPKAAVRAALPARLAPQLASAAACVPAKGHWCCEIKLDGYRIMARIEGGQVALITRGGHNWAPKLPGLVAELAALPLRSAWLDGEIVVLDEGGRPNFGRLQRAVDHAHGAAAAEIDYFVFDLPYFQGLDLREAPLVERRAALNALLAASPRTHLRFSADFAGDAAAVFESACRMGLEGVVAKRADAGYASGRSRSWLKLKCRQRQVFVIVGYTERSGGAAQVGSLLLGTRGPDGTLLPAGRVGTGWDAAQAQALKRQLERIEVPTPAFNSGLGNTARPPRRAGAAAARWVKPRLLAEVEYAELTAAGCVRQASFIALRDGAPAHTAGARSSTRAASASASGDRAARAAPQPGSAALLGGIKVSHGERVIDVSTGLSKLDLVRYYESVAQWMLPHLKGRPCSLVRGPAGVAGELFFQKHAEGTAMPGAKVLARALWPGHEPLLEIATPRALVGAAQMNVIEFHTWNSSVGNIGKANRMIFDLDPGAGTPWEQVQEAATLVHGLLQQLGLQSWLKTSGGKGLHIVVPLAARCDNTTVHAFSKAVVEHLARVIPSRFVSISGPANRVRKLFVDYLRNSPGATTAAAFSARARPGLGVSMPLSWDALAALKGGAEWNIRNAREHLSLQVADPWAGYWRTRQTLSSAMQALAFKPARDAH